MTVLLRTVHGSRLYGLAHPGSDYDTYLVVANGTKRAQQKIHGDQDVMILTLGEFARQVHKGVPQSLEALFSPVADRVALDAYRFHFYPHTVMSTETYRRAMKSFSLGGTVKSRRHALRLAVNLAELVDRGQFTPALSPALGDDLTALAEGHPDPYLDALRALSPVDPYSGVEDYREVLAASYEPTG